MFINHSVTGRPLFSMRPVRQLGLATSVAVDAGCLAASGLAGAIAFGFAWVVLKIGGVI